jgi:predicted NBD/HSP70 family sugar kinase
MEHATTWLDGSYRGIPQQQTAKLAGVSTATVSVICRELRDQGLLKPGENGALDPSRGVVFGVDIGYSQIRVAIADLNGQTLADPVELSTPLGHQAWRSIDWVAETVKTLLSDAKKSGLGHDAAVLGIGITIPGPVNPRVGKLNTVWNFGGDWQFLSASDELRQRLGWDCEITLDRDANAAAMAEGIWGTAQNVEDVLYVKWSDSGVAAGLILNNRIYRGADGWAGEVGHATIPAFPDDESLLKGWLESLPACGHCKRQNCLFTVTSLDALRSYVGDAALTASDLVELARSRSNESTNGEQQRAYDGIRLAARCVGRALAISIDALEPQRLVLGGKIGASVYPMVAVPLNEGIQEARSSPAPNGPETYPGNQKLIGPASVRGAVALALLTTQPKLLNLAAKVPQAHMATLA